MSSHDCVDEVVARKLHANASAWLNSAQRTFDTAKDSLRSAKEAMTEASDSLSLAQEAEMEARSYLQGALIHKRRKTEQTISLSVYERLSRPASSTEQTSSPPLNKEDTKDQTTRSSKRTSSNRLNQGLISFLVDALSRSNLGPFENNNDVKDAIQQLYPQGKRIPTDMLPFENRLANKMRKHVEAKKELVRDQPEYAHSMTGQTETTQQAELLDISWMEEIAPSVLAVLNRKHSASTLKSSEEYF